MHPPKVVDPEQTEVLTLQDRFNLPATLKQAQDAPEGLVMVRGAYLARICRAALAAPEPVTWISRRALEILRTSNEAQIWAYKHGDDDVYCIPLFVAPAAHPRPTEPQGEKP